MIKLPKDAESREIPLDTVVLFSRSGEAHNIVRWIYTTEFETWTEPNIWRAIDENQRSIDPELMYLEKPDSLKQIAEDLNRMVDCKRGYGYSSPSCAYTGNNGSTCDCCKLKDSSDICSVAVIKDIADRVNRLCGDSE